MATGTPAPSSEFEVVERTAESLLRRVAEAGGAVSLPELAVEWQRAFSDARAAPRPPPEELTSISRFGMQSLAGRAAVLRSQSSEGRALTHALAATVVELRATGRSGLAIALSSLVISISGDEAIAPLLPFYTCLEALVRCRFVQETVSEEAAIPFWRLAAGLAAAPVRPRLVLIGGPSGSGKSFVANGIAAALGAHVVSSDRERKLLSGVPLTQRTPVELQREVYNTRTTDRVYRLLADRARDELQAGFPVVLDATYLTPVRRALPLQTARDLGAEATILWCRLGERAARDRLRVRATRGWSVSDADGRMRGGQRSVMRAPRETESGATVLQLDTSVSPEKLLAGLVATLDRA